MTYAQSELKLRQMMAQTTGTQPKDWFFVYKARYGMEAIFQALAETNGVGEILTTPFTCVVAVNPILHSGNIPIYGEMSKNDMALDLTKIKLSAQTRGIVIQNTFGILQNASLVRDLVDKENLFVLEDSAHCVGRMIRNDENHPLADVSVHSFGVEKVLKTRFGAAIWINPKMKDLQLHKAITQKLENLSPLSFPVSAIARTYRPVNGILNRLPSSVSSKLMNFLISLGLFDSTQNPKEQEAISLHRPMKAASWMLKEMIRHLESLEENYRQREKAVNFYLKSLKEVELVEIPKAVEAIQPLLRFPLLFDSPEKAEFYYSYLKEKGIRVVHWYYPLFAPGIRDFEKYHFKNNCPISEDIASRILDLPTNVSLEEAAEIVAILTRKVK